MGGNFLRAKLVVIETMNVPPHIFHFRWAKNDGRYHGNGNDASTCINPLHYAINDNYSITIPSSCIWLHRFRPRTTIQQTSHVKPPPTRARIVKQPKTMKPATVLISFAIGAAAQNTSSRGVGNIRAARALNDQQQESTVIDKFAALASRREGGKDTPLCCGAE